MTSSAASTRWRTAVGAGQGGGGSRVMLTGASRAAGGGEGGHCRGAATLRYNALRPPSRGGVMLVLKYPFGTVESVEFSPDSRRLLASGVLYELPSGTARELPRG